LAASFFPEIVVGEGHGKDRIVGSATYPVFRSAFRAFEHFRDLEPARPPVIEPGSHLDAGAWAHGRRC
jgi:hypothetical protein